MRKYDYTELVAWQRAMDLAVAVYQASASLPAEERFGLQAQTHIHLAQRLTMMKEDAGKGILDRAAEVGRLINGLSKSLRTKTTDNRQLTTDN